MTITTNTSDENTKTNTIDTATVPELTIDPNQRSVYMIAHRNPDVSSEDARLEDYNLLYRHVDNLKYLFIYNKDIQDESNDIKYEVKQFITGENIVTANQLGSFVGEYLSSDDDDTDDVTVSNMEILTTKFYAADTYDKASDLKRELIDKQTTYHGSLVLPAQNDVPLLQLEIVDMVLLIGEYITRVIMPSVLEDPEKASQLTNVLTNILKDRQSMEDTINNGEFD